VSAHKTHLVHALALGLCIAGCGDDVSAPQQPASSTHEDHTAHVLDAAAKGAADAKDAKVDGKAAHADVASHASSDASPPSDANVSSSDAGAVGDPHGHAQAEDAGAAALHCRGPAHVDPRDDQLASVPQEKAVGLSKDLLLPQGVLDWMEEHEMPPAHDAWHLIRRWDQNCRKSNAPAEGCAAAQRLEAQGLWRAQAQQGGPGDGYQFMVMHRHMIEQLKATFPKHADLFKGFTHVPRTQQDDQNFMTWKRISWTSSNLTGFDILENIEKNLAMFPTEDALGRFFQTTFRWTEQRPMETLNEPGSGLHGALHAQWAVNGSPANLIDQKVDVRNFLFWKLHGWIDDVWERYRRAKGLTADDPSYVAALEAQCEEMYYLMPSHRKTGPGSDGGVPTTAPSDETGVFAKTVRPFLESTCTGCHLDSGPTAGLVLGGGISSSEIIDGIVNVKASNDQYNLIEPGAPDKSWLYLKASGAAEQASCTGKCDRGSMPPSGMGLTTAQLASLRTWIMNGASKN
jgi:hypothetical protein